MKIETCHSFHATTDSFRPVKDETLVFEPSCIRFLFYPNPNAAEYFSHILLLERENVFCACFYPCFAPSSLCTLPPN